MSYFQAIFEEPMAIIFGLPGAQSRALGPRILILGSIFKIGGLPAFLTGVAQPTRCTKFSYSSSKGAQKSFERESAIRIFQGDEE